MGLGVKDHYAEIFGLAEPQDNEERKEPAAENSEAIIVSLLRQFKKNVYQK